MIPRSQVASTNQHHDHCASHSIGEPVDLMLAAVGEGRQRTWEATSTEWMEAQRTNGGYSPQLSKASRDTGITSAPVMAPKSLAITDNHDHVEHALHFCRGRR